MRRRFTEQVFEGFGVAVDGDAFRCGVCGVQASVGVAVLLVDPVAVSFEEMARAAFRVEVVTRGRTAIRGMGVVVFGDVVEVAVESRTFTAGFGAVTVAQGGRDLGEAISQGEAIYVIDPALCTGVDHRDFGI